MNKVASYQRPASIDEACKLIAAGGVIVGGGTKLNCNTNPLDGPPVERDLVDVQALGLDHISDDGDGNATIGAYVTIQQLADDERLPAVIRDAARREAPRTTRNSATVGGTIGAAVAHSELLAALLAFGATVRTASVSGSTEIDLGEMLAGPSRPVLITEVHIETAGAAAADRVGRTPSDDPIVAVVCRDVGGSLFVGVAGVAEAPRLVDPDRLDELEPPRDFRGSPEYRRHLATVLTARVSKELSR